MLNHQTSPHPVLAGTVKKADDEASIGSTVTVDRINQKEACPTQTKFAGKRSRVMFDTQRNREYPTKPIYEDELYDKWFCKQDYRQMKENFIQLGRHFQSFTSDERFTFKAVLIQVFDACCQATEDPQTCLLGVEDEDFLRRCLNQEIRCGMERASVLSIFCDKSSRRKRLRHAVFTTQAQTTDKDATERAEMIRNTSREITRASRHFAWRLA